MATAILELRTAGPAPGRLARALALLELCRALAAAAEIGRVPQNLLARLGLPPAS
jgi:hypothetical protein